MSPDDESTKPLVARSISEGFALVRRICKRYLLTGRDTDDNRLEQIDERDVTSETIKATSAGVEGTTKLTSGKACTITVKTSGTVTVSVGSTSLGTASGVSTFEYTASGADEKVKLTASGSTNVEATVSYKYGEFGTLELELAMPSTFNKGVTETIKSSCHRIIVDYTVRALMIDQYPDKAQQYAQRLEEDESNLRGALVSRVDFTRRTADWS
jgi:hypothetical protein